MKFQRVVRSPRAVKALRPACALSVFLPMALVFLSLASPATAQTPQTNRTRNPHGTINLACENCHTAISWSPIRAKPEFDHNTQTKYPLRGMHETAACTRCHTDLNFKNVSQQCSSCHADIHRNQFGNRCESCHTVQGWNMAVKEFRDHQNRFPLLGAHAAAQCAECHKGAATGVFTGLSTQCVSCHQNEFNNAKSINHRTAGFSTNCAECHGVDQWQGAKFDHNSKTSFPLAGPHASATCNACHSSGQFKGLSTACISCHAKELQATTNPNHISAGFPAECGTCHTVFTWNEAKFDHETMAHFALTGAHAKVECNQCHEGGRFAGTPNNCYGCHSADFEKTTNPDHRNGKFSTQCETCHTTEVWQGAKFDHNLSRFPLTGAHVATDCALCHVDHKLTGTPTECVACHSADFAKTTSPDHKAAGFSQACATCHTTVQWAGAKFDHNAQTKFALTGKHSNVACTQCHVNGQFAGTSMECASCHQADFKQAKNPDHSAAGFPQDCKLCHTSANWTDAKFDHNAQTKFALTGAHVSAACGSCHVNNVFTGTPTDCTGCHMNDFNNSKNPSHKASAFPTNCTLCHNTSQWTGAKFDHNAQTKFSLTGSHVTVACGLCHTNNVFAGTPKDCYPCHSKDFNTTTIVDHRAAGFAQNCVLCHNTANWTQAKFDHGQTKFALIGAHVNVACNVCHVNSQYTGIATNCSGCHTNDFNNSKNPSHKAAGFPMDCALCHTSVKWQGAAFNHNSQTKFALTGLHTTATCAQCHVNNQFAGTSTDCAACHITDYNNSKNPNHKTGAFPTTCAVCHTTNGWRPANFDHSTTKFPLQGAHTSVTCQQCHGNGQYATLPTSCDSCHLAKFNATANPKHSAAAFGTTCSNCHSTNPGWKPTTWNHTTQTKFTLTGAHTTVNSCNTCHTGNKFAGFGTACVTCHQQDYNGTATKGGAVPNHVASQFPTTCETCHSTINWSGATFDHSKFKFTLTGWHAGLACAQCHSSGQYATLPTTCESCHLTKFNATANPKHSAAAFGTSCIACHTTAPGWKPTTWNHNSQTKFTLTGAHTTVNSCNTCHTGNKFAGFGTACATCHQQDYNGTATKGGAVPNHVASQFPTTCETCHSTVNWSGASFDHSKYKFTLTGAHTSVTCQQCHSSGQYATLPTTCESCHLAKYSATSNPKHSSAAFGTSCIACHTTAPGWKPTTFNHSTQTSFPLTGAHTTVTSCNQCHTVTPFSAQPTTCVNCHQADYNSTKGKGGAVPDHVTNSFPTTCESCHSTANWSSATFDHSKFKFTLTGGHVGLTCAQCHSSGQYATLPTTCESCHLPKFNATSNPKHSAAAFGTSCIACHTTAPGWKPTTWNHTTQTKFTLTGAHTTVSSCNTCHTGNKFAGFGTACITCHQADYNGTATKGGAVPNHVASSFPTTCETCHSTTNWTSATFDHSKFKFTLTGGHVGLTCQQCHSSGQYATLPTNCDSCHLPNYNATSNPKHTSAGFGVTCNTCHTTAPGWKPTTWNHTTQTKFTLTGAHTTVNSCNTCHTNNKFAGFGTACVTCHQQDYNNTATMGGAVPNHVASSFPTTCETCHSTTNWTSATFDHSKFKFTLTGGHVGLICQQCHSSGQYATLPTNCDSCHLPKYNATSNPKHTSAGFGVTCNNCHTTTPGWKPTTFNHTTQTSFPLTGAHTAAASCNLCHTVTPFSAQATTCVSCHQADYNATATMGGAVPNHAASSFPTTCESCHSTTNWASATFDHSKFRFALTGAHTSLTCQQCHSSGQYATLPTNCDSCHLPKYNATANPKHSSAGFGVACNTCHTTTPGWKPTTWSHTTQTKFPLTGTHTTVTSCNTCHTNNKFAGFGTTCITCHQADYNSTATKGGAVPNHVSAAFPTTCEQCHTTTNWTNATFDHSKYKFPLTGKHTTLTCAQCHSSGQYATLPTNCDSCHLAKYTATTNPAHAAAGFPKDCSLCHSTANWTSAIFDHSKFKFPLTGTHLTATCAQCHSSGQYATLPTTCISCHQTEFNSTATKGGAVPNHLSGFPPDCTLCHGTVNWTSSTFNHATDPKYALTGAHLTKPTCVQCHVGGNYTTIPTDCWSCHQTVYNATTDPGHKAANFAQTCLTCHTMVAGWGGAKYTAHDTKDFPIYSGRHNGQWTSCSQCHANSGNYTVFNCTGTCHQHDATNVTPHHSGVKNYVYSPTSCYGCHPKGNAG